MNVSKFCFNFQAMDKLFIGWINCGIRLHVFNLLLLLQNKVCSQSITLSYLLIDISRHLLWLRYSNLYQHFFQNVRIVSDVVLLWLHGIVFWCSRYDVWDSWIHRNVIFCSKNIFHCQDWLKNLQKVLEFVTSKGPSGLRSKEIRFRFWE